MKLLHDAPRACLLALIQSVKRITLRVDTRARCSPARPCTALTRSAPLRSRETILPGDRRVLHLGIETRRPRCAIPEALLDIAHPAGAGHPSRLSTLCVQE